jgi:acetyltransferase-like isoleucine patch superfamily enzyme
MKSTVRDYVVSGVAIAFLLALTLGTIWLLQPLSRTLFSDYHVIVELLLGLWVYGLLSAGLVRVLLRVRAVAPRTYDMGDPMFSYWMLLTVLYRLGKGALRPVAPFFAQPLVEALFGARVGRNVALGGSIDDPYQVTLGDDVIVGDSSLVSGNYISGGKLVCGTVTIGAGATIGAHCVILPNTEIEAGAIVAGGSFVMPGTRIPAGESWRGNPARKWLGKPAPPAPD